MPSYDLSDYLADDALTLRGIPSVKHPGGTAYTIPSPSAKFGLQLQRITQLRAERGADAPPSEDELLELVALVTDDATGELVDFDTRLFGPALQAMVDDGVSADRLQMIRTLVITHYGSGSAVARSIVEAATGEAKARGNRATRRATKSTPRKTAGSKSSRASTAGTRSARARASATTESSTSADAPEGQSKAVGPGRSCSPTGTSSNGTSPTRVSTSGTSSS